MIDLDQERLIPLRDVAEILPRRPTGKKVHFSTVWRWAQKGLRGVKLETLRAGGVLCSSREALQRFFNELTDPQTPQPVRTPAQRQRAHQRAEAELAAEGI